MPKILDERLKDLTMLDYSVYVQFNEQSKKLAQHIAKIQVHPNPSFKEAQIFSDKTKIILIEVKCSISLTRLD